MLPEGVDDTCLICREPESDFRTVCKHVFHIQCYVVWHRTNLVCPLCRAMQPGIYEAISKNDLDAFKLCLNLGEAMKRSPDRADGSETYPIHQCITDGRHDMANLWLEYLDNIFDHHLICASPRLTTLALRNLDLRMLKMILEHKNSKFYRKDEILYAVSSQPIEVIEFLVRNGCEVKIRVQDGELRPYYIRNCITEAIKANRGFKYIIRLLELGAELSLGGCQEISMAVNAGRRDLAELFIKNGGNVNYVRVPSDCSLLMIMMILMIQDTQLTKIQMLLDIGADINYVAARDTNRTALEIAARRGNLDDVKFLVGKGAEIGNLWSESFSVYKFTGYSDSKVFNYLLQRTLADLSAHDDTKIGHLVSAVFLYHDIQAYKAVLKAFKDANRPFDADLYLFQAVSNGYETSTSFILSEYKNHGARDANGATPLIVAIKAHFTDIAHILIIAGANVDAVDNAGFTALHYADTNVRISAAELLISKGASLNHKDKNGRTLLHKLAPTRNTRLIRLLATHKANVTLKDKNGLTPIEIAIRGDRRKAAKVLVQAKLNLL